MAPTVAEQLAARKQSQAKPAAKDEPKAAATKTTGRRTRTKPAATKAAETKTAEPEVKETPAEEPAAETETKTKRKQAAPKPELTAEQLAEKARLKEERKQQAFEKLREMNQKKKVARASALQQDLAAAKEALLPDGKPGKVVYSTRASYYGVRCVVQDVIELRGRILVSVKCTTTKSGQELAEESWYDRNFGLDFLQDDPVTEEYEPRRDGPTKRREKFEKKKTREEKLAKKAERAAAKAAAGDDSEDEADLEDLDLEDGDDEEVDLEDEVDAELDDEAAEDLDDDEDEDDDEEDGEDEAGEPEAADEAETDSWG